MALVLVTCGCTSERMTPKSVAPAQSSASTAPLAFSPQRACAERVPGAQHSLLTTVAKVRRSGMGLIVTPAARTFAPGAWPDDPAAYCYRWLPDQALDEWWGVSGSGASVRLGGFGGVHRDLGVFDGAATD